MYECQVAWLYMIQQNQCQCTLSFSVSCNSELFSNERQNINYLRNKFHFSEVYRSVKYIQSRAKKALTNNLISDKNEAVKDLQAV